MIFVPEKHPLFASGEMVALVTGSSRKLGKHLAVHLGEIGFSVAVHYLAGKERAKKVVKKIIDRGLPGVKAHAFKADLSDPKQAKKVVDSVVKKFGRIDLLINNVGNYLNKPISKVTEKEWRYIIGTNLHSTFYCTQAALPHMRKQGYGRVINIGFSPIGKIQAMPKVTPYFIAKTGVLLYSKAVAVEEIKRGITVNVISPGHTFDSVGNKEKEIKKIPAGRFAYPRDFFGLIDYIVSDESDYVTGNHFIVSGGYSI